MKYFITIIFCLHHLITCSQENSKTDTLRIQGYMIIETSLYNDLSDKPYLYAFIPSGNMKNNLKESYESYNALNGNAIFVCNPYISNDLDIGALNTVFKKIIVPGSNYNFISIIDKNVFFKKSNALFQFKQQENPIKAFKIIYIDGLWLKVKVDRKNSGLIVQHNKQLLDYKKDYDFYFLVDTYFTGYNIDINDTSINEINFSIKPKDD